MILERCLHTTSPGHMCTVFTQDPMFILSEIELDAATYEDMLFSVCLLSPLPDVHSLLSQAIETLASAALSLFPAWYGGSLNLDPTSSLSASAQLNMPANTHLWNGPGPSKSWLQGAVHCCLAGKPPLPRKYPHHIQAEQLSLAIGQQRLCLVLAVDETSPKADHLMGLAKAAEWLARMTRGRIVIILPEDIATWPEVHSIGFASLVGQTVLSPTIARTGNAPSHFRERKYTAWPVPGIPHPASPGEQILAEHLSHDQMLAPLFTFNQYVHTIRESVFLVDLLWRQGQLIVEVDGYATHSSRQAFHQDRHRDYELMITGYLVLRLPHDEVTAEPSSAVAKIRDLVLWKMGLQSEQKNQ